MASVKGDVMVLDKVLERLAALVGNAEGCTVADEHKEAVRRYVTTWITPAVEAVRDDLAGTRRLPDYMVKGY